LEKAFFFFTNFILVVSIVNLILPTLPYFKSINSTNSDNSSSINIIDPTISIGFSIVEFICVGWFTLEVIIRLFVSYSKKKFFISAYNLIDIGVLIPFYLWLILSFLNFTLLRKIGNMLKILRLFKCSRYSKSLSSLGVIVKRSLKEFIVLLFFLMIFLLVFASFLYYLEVDIPDSDYPDGIGFDSIPRSLW
jgi:hypothetical protein